MLYFTTLKGFSTGQHTQPSLEYRSRIIWALLYELKVDSTAGNMSISNTDSLATTHSNSAKNLCDLPDELLLQVLSAVPVECRVGIRTVSKKWHGIVLDLGYHIEPDFMVSGYPHYAFEIPMKLNPAICDFTKKPFDLTRPVQRGLIDQRDLTELLSRRSEFITSPPVSMLSVTWCDRSYRLQHKSIPMVLRTATSGWKRSEGIRIGDLLDILEKTSMSLEDRRPRYSVMIPGVSTKGRVPITLSLLPYALNVSLIKSSENDHRVYFMDQEISGGSSIKLRKWRWR